MAARPSFTAAALASAAVALAAAATACRAEPAPPASAAALNAAVSARFADAGAGKAQGMARTSIDHRFEGNEASGALVFLCGRPDSLDDRAAGSALGSDPHGRFLGARLSLAFR